MAENSVPHTPGPWRAFKELSGSWTITTGDDAAVIGEVYGQGESEVAEAQAEADTRLIAAAPDLMAALKRLVFAAASRENTMGDPIDLLNAKYELRQATDAARAAIAKAKGGA